MGLSKTGEWVDYPVGVMVENAKLYAYKERTGLEADFYVCGVSEGVHQMKGEL
jgi:hypothetical protein